MRPDAITEAQRAAREAERQRLRRAQGDADLTSEIDRVIRRRTSPVVRTPRDDPPSLKIVELPPADTFIEIHESSDEGSEWLVYLVIAVMGVICAGLVLMAIVHAARGHW